MRLEGKVALITGAAAGVRGELMGFGGAAAWIFVGEGAQVVLSDINDEMGEKTTAEIRRNGGEATYVHLDVTNEQDWKDAIQKTVSIYGRLDILINDAGTGSRTVVEDTTVEASDESSFVTGSELVIDGGVTAQ